MFCSNCGKELEDSATFCSDCGQSTGVHKVLPSESVKFVLDPSEVVETKPVADSSKTFSGQGKVIGLILMIFSIVGDLVAMFVIGFDAFIPITTASTVLFVIGFLLRVFCP